MADKDRAHTRRGGPVLDTIDLEEPIHAHGQELSQLSFYRVRARDLRVLDEEEGEVGQTIAMLARMTDTTPEAIDELVLEDFEKAAEVMERFFGKFAASQINKGSKRRRVGKTSARKASGKRSRA
jgi:hypothetical protein